MPIPRQQSSRAEVLTKALIRAAERLGLSRQELAATLGLSPATLSRMYSGRYVLDENSKCWELAALLVRLYRGLDAIVAGDERTLQAWIRNPNIDLHGVPAELIEHISGLNTVVAYVDANRARI
ncbi:MAG TPA: DUF2384 domain-containing protein [Gammaproteobacteria bacterium]|nr:DUF2384 domain-containing protein [Gammaproteobacteria bacterium]